TVYFILLRISRLFLLVPYTTLFRSLLRLAPIPGVGDQQRPCRRKPGQRDGGLRPGADQRRGRRAPHTGEFSHPAPGALERMPWVDRKSTRLNSSHVKISYAVFCLKK